MNIALDTQNRKDYYLIKVNGKFATTSVDEVRKAAETAIKMKL